MYLFRVFTLILCCLFTTNLFATSDLSITRITPIGEDVTQRDQIIIEFNRAVVPLGRMDRKAEEIPVEITPKVNCQWRWLTSSTLACQLNEKDQLQLATHYEVTVNPGIKAEDGGKLTKPCIHEFVTLRPNVTNVWLATWLTPNKPVIRVSFNQAVTADSLLHHLYFTDTKTNDYIAVQVEPDPQANNANEQDQNWLITPERALPAGKEIAFKIEAGIASKVGSEKGETEQTLLSFHTFPVFKFKGLSCTNTAGKEIIITPHHLQADTEENLCDPTATINLRFTAPVSTEEFKQHIQFKPTIKNLLKNTQADDQTYEKSRLVDGVQPAADYIFNLHAWSDTPLKSMQQYNVTLESMATYHWWAKLLEYVGIKPRGAVIDIFGRHLYHPATLQFKTGHRKPNYVLPYEVAVLEKNIDSDIPLYITNIQALKITYDKVTQTGIQKNLQLQPMLPKVNDLQFAVPLEIRKLLDGQSGLLAMQISTQPKVGEEPAKLLVQVTPYQVAAKIGHFNSLVWVTDFATGLPVANAKIALSIDPPFLATKDTNNLTAQTDSNGIALIPGTATLDTIPKPVDANWNIRVDTEHDMAWLPLDYNFQIYGYRMGDVYNTSREKYGHIITWGTTAQGIYRPGETVQYKIYIRDQNVRTLTAAPQQTYTLEIKDPTGKTVNTIEHIKLDTFGTLQGEYTVPKEAVAGWYEFSLASDFAKTTWEPLRVLITDFTPSPFKVTNQLNGDTFNHNQIVEVTSAAKLHAGGPYGNAKLRVTAAIIPKTFSTQNPQLKDFDFYQPDAKNDVVEIYQKSFTLDKNGESQTQFTLPPQTISYGKLSIESAVQDERGKYVVAHTSANYFGVDRLLGWHPKAWLFIANKPAAVDYVVVDKQGNPVANTKVSIAIEREVYKAARVKSAGEVYTTEFKQTWEKVGTCEAPSQITPKTTSNSCVFTPSQAGNYRLTAHLVDTQGVAYTTNTTVWVTGSDYVMWNQDADTALPIIPEKSTFQIGDKARFLVKNPYPGALALITVERYGIIDHWVQKLEGSTPTITVPIKPDYLPGFYLSVSVFTPRANNKPLQIGQIDLAKPAARFGYVKVNVDDPYKQLDISAKTDRDTYKPGETVHLQMHVKPRVGQLQPTELAVAVVDEAVLDLLHDPNKHYDIYHGLYQLADLDVANYSLINRLVGRQKFEKKGANPGGDGGAAFSMRSLFKYVSYWNPSIVVDANGYANTHFTLPDNLTRWRIIVLGITKTDQMGTGTTDFTVNRLTELRPTIPNHVLADDQFIAGFSVMNRFAKTRTLTVELRATGAIKSAAHTKTTITLEPFQRKIVTLPISVNHYDYANIQTNRITIKATASDATDSDGLTQTITVDPLTSLETVASYGMTNQSQAQQTVVVPKAIHPHAGGLSLTLSPTVIGGNLEGVFRYGRDYPYTCWEQKLTKAVLASQFKTLKAYVAPHLQWPDSDALPEKTLQEAVNFQANNGGMAYFTATDSHTDPYLSAYTALQFNWLKQQGYAVPETVSKNLTTYLQTFLRKDQSRDFYTQSMTATVRAVALAALAPAISATDLDRLRDYLPNMSLFGLAHYLQAAIQVPNSDTLQQLIVDKILSHAQQDADKTTFTETVDNGYSRILASPLRDTCAVMTALLDYQQAHPQENYQNTFFRIVRGITQARGARDHWENTQENTFCMQALTRYSQTYETQKPDMRFVAQLNNEKLGEGELRNLQATPLTFTQAFTPTLLGKPLTIEIQREGEGRYYYNTHLQYAPLDLLTQNQNHGMEIHRQYHVQREGRWVLLNTDTIQSGDLIRIDLDLNLTAPRNFVVVDDPVPGGLEPVNAALATSSTVDMPESSPSFYHQEMRNDAVRFYADHLEPGHYHLSYVAQAISAGEFTILPTLVQEMYSPEVSGKTSTRKLVINK